MHHHTYDTIVIGAGQAGLAAGYHLTQRGRPFLIIDSDKLTRRDRDDFASLFMEAAANLTGGSAGRVVH